MEFLEMIQDEVCHLEGISLGPGPQLVCNACPRVVVPNIYEYIVKPWDDHFRSSELAQAYHLWTSDDRVPLTFPLVECEGMYDKCVFGRSIGHVRQSIRLLRALNAPFTTDFIVRSFPEMDSFLGNFLQVVHQHPDDTHERKVLDALIQGMHDVLSSKDMVNPFETYFKILVPYVQKCREKWEPLQAKAEDPNLAREMMFQLNKSSLIRKVFGQYSIPFDVLHVMVCSYACSGDMEVVGNWALDFLARACRGAFFWRRYPECHFVQTMDKLILSQITYSKNTEFYWILKHIREGDSMEHYSVFWEGFHKLQEFLKSKYKPKAVSSEVVDMAFCQTFPAVVFKDHADQLGFTFGYNHILMTFHRRGKMPKNVYKMAKRIHEITKAFIERVQEFEERGAMLWTMATLKLFFAADQKLEEDIIEIMKLILTNEKECRDE